MVYSISIVALALLVSITCINIFQDRKTRTNKQTKEVSEQVSRREPEPATIRINQDQVVRLKADQEVAVDVRDVPNLDVEVITISQDGSIRDKYPNGWIHLPDNGLKELDGQGTVRIDFFGPRGRQFITLQKVEQ